LQLKEPSLAATFDAASFSYSSDVCWSPANPAVFAGGDVDGNVRLFHVGKGTALDAKAGGSAVAGLAAGVPSTNVNAALTALAIASGNTARSVTDVTLPVGFYRLKLADTLRKEKPKYHQRGAAVTRLRFSPDGKYLAVGTLNGELHLLSLNPEYAASGAVMRRRRLSQPSGRELRAIQL
jgi:WD40 repeat protein